MSDNSHAGAAGLGALALLGATVWRFADDAMRVGARGVDDLAHVGAAGTVDDAARTGSHVDDTARFGPTNPVDDGTRKGAARSTAPKPVLLPDEELRAGEQLVEVSVDVGFEFAAFEFEGDPQPPESFVEQVHRPKYVDLVAEPGWWVRFAHAGEEAHRAPWVFNARFRNDGLLVDNDHVVPVNELAASCWRLGTTCIFVACENEACSKATRDVFDASSPRMNQRVDTFTAEFVATRIDTAPQPAFVLFAGGSDKREFTLVSPESK